MVFFKILLFESQGELCTPLKVYEIGYPELLLHQPRTAERRV